MKPDTSPEIEIKEQFFEGKNPISIENHQIESNQHKKKYNHTLKTVKVIKNFRKITKQFLNLIVFL